MKRASAPATAARHPSYLGLGTRLVLLVAAAGTSVLLMRPDLVAPGAPVALASDDYVPTLHDFFPNARAEDVDELEIQHPNQSLVRLRLMDEQWRVLHGDEWLAIGADRRALLLRDTDGRDELGRNESGRGLTGHFQGANPANHDRSFSIGDGMGTRVKFLRQGEVIEDIVLGRTIARADGPATFVRRHGRDEVYLVAGDLRNNVAAQSSNEWLMGRVFAGLDTEAVARLAVEWTEAGRDVRYTLVRAPEAPTGWRVEFDGQALPARASLVRGVLASLSAMESLGVLDGASASTAGSVARLRVDTADGTPPRVVLLGATLPDDDGRHMATLSGSPHPFALRRPHVLLRDPAEFVDDRAVAQVGENRLANP